MQTKLAAGTILAGGVDLKDAEYKTVGDKNSSSTKFGVKVGERQSPNADEKPQSVFVNCTCWHSIAKAAKNIKKFDVVMCFGKIEEYTYKKDGEDKTGKQLNCEGVFIMGSPSQMAAPAESNGLPDDLSAFEEILGDGQLPF